MSDNVTIYLEDSISAAIGDGRLSAKETIAVRKELAELAERAAAYDALKAENERLRRMPDVDRQLRLEADVRIRDREIVLMQQRIAALLPVFEALRKIEGGWVADDIGEDDCERIVEALQAIARHALERANAIAPKEKT
jgi:hypothetical protein